MFLYAWVMNWLYEERGDVNLHGGLGLVALVIFIVFILYLTERAGVTNIFD
jgi:hypothetical protein